MRTIIKIFFLLLIACSVKAQVPPAPSGFPAPYSAAYYRIGWLQSDSGLILASRDTSVRSKFAGLMFLWQHAGLDSSQWFYNGSRYIKTFNSQDTLPGRFLVTNSALNNQGFLKNITGFVQQGTNVTITGSGTLLSPYVINSTASGGGDSAVNPGLFLGQSISGTTKTLYNDTSVTGFSGYYLRRKDSALYVTQTQLSTGLSSKQNSLTTGTTLQYFRGDLSLATFPTNLSAFTNGPGYITGNQSISFTASGDVSGTFTNPTTLTPTLTIGNNKVTYAKFQASSQQALLGATGAGNFQEITLGTGLSMSGNTLNATGGAGISVDTIYRTLGKDSIQFTIGGRYHSILDSAGGSGTSTLTNTHIFVGNASNVATDVALGGDATMANTGALTLNTVNSNVGSFGSASTVATFTANGKGLLTAAGSTSIQIAESQVTNLTTDLAGKQATGNYITALTGDVTASGPGSVAATIANNAITTVKINNNAVTYGKFQAASGASLLGATGAGNFGEITLGTGLSFAGSVLNAAAGGATNSNIGSGFRWAVPNTNNIKSFFGSTYLGLDSSTNTNALTLKMANSTANTLLGYDASGVPANITAGTNVTISAGVISASGGSLPAITNYSYRGKLGGSDTILQYSTANVLDIGLKNDSSTDNTAILRAWLANPANARFTSLYFPGGGTGTGYLFSDSVLFLNPMNIYGDGPAGLDTFYTIIQLGKGATNLYMTSTTKSLFVFSNTSANKSPGFSVRNLSIINRNYYATAGSAIRFISNTMHPLIEHCTFRGFYIQIDNQSSMYADLLFNTFMAPGYCSLQQDNKVEVDAGAIKIIGNDFFAGTNTVNPPMYAIVIHGGGDIHIESNSFNAQEPFTSNSQYRVFVFSDFSTGATSDIWIHGNIMENFNSRAIWLRNLSGGRVTNIQIYANEIAPYSSDTASLQAAIEIDSMTNISIDLITALNSPNVNRALIKLQQDTTVTLGASIIYNNYNLNRGYQVQDSLIGCWEVIRAAKTKGISRVTTAPFVLVHQDDGQNHYDSLISQMPVDSFKVHFANFSPTVSYPLTGAGVVGFNTIQLGSVSMAAPGILSTGIDSINGEKRFANDLKSGGVYFGSGNNTGLGNISIYPVNGLQASITGSNNFSVGAQSLHNLTSGSENIGVGPSVFSALTTQSHDIGIGSSVGTSATSPDNTIIGWHAFIGTTSGSGLNTGMGSQFLAANTTGNTNTGGGYQSLNHNTTGNNNTAWGAYSLFANVVGNNNTAIGTSAGFSNTGSGGLFGGNQAGYYETANNRLDFANSPTAHLISGDFSTGQICLFCTTTGTNQISLTSGAGFEVRGVKGFLWNNMTTTTRNALTTASGLRVINADSLYAEDYFDGTAWQEGASRNWVRANFGSGGTPGGSNTQVQFNNSGAFGGSANLTFNGTTLTANAMAISTYAAAGTNDSVVMWNPSTKLLEMRSGTFNLNVGNGLSPGSTTDSIIFGGTLTRNTTLANGGNNLTFSGSGIFSVSSPFIFGAGAATDANYSVGSETIVNLPVITANRTVTLPSVSTYSGRVITLTDYNTANFNWVFSPTPIDGNGTGVPINYLTNGATYDLYSNGTNWILRNIRYGTNATVIPGWQTITSGTTGTVNNQQTNVLINPASLIATYTLTLPSFPADGQVVKVHFGGTIAGNGTVVTTLTISPNSGQTITQKVAPITALSGDCFIFAWNVGGSNWYREQ